MKCYTKPGLKKINLAQSQSVSAQFGEPFDVFTDYEINGAFSAITSYNLMSGVVG